MYEGWVHSNIQIINSHFSLVRSNISVGTLFSKIYNLCSSLHVSSIALHPYVAAGKMNVSADTLTSCKQSVGLNNNFQNTLFSCLSMKPVSVPRHFNCEIFSNTAQSHKCWALTALANDLVTSWRLYFANSESKVKLSNCAEKYIASCSRSVRTASMAVAAQHPVSLGC